MHPSILALSLLFFAFGINANTVDCNYRIYRPIPCIYRRSPQYQLASFDSRLKRLDRVEGNFGRRYDRGTIKEYRFGRTFISYRMYRLGPGCRNKRPGPGLIVELGVGGTECACTTSPICEKGSGALGVVYRTRKYGFLKLKCENTQAHCLRIQLACKDLWGCPVNYVSNQHVPKECAGSSSLSVVNAR